MKRSILIGALLVTAVLRSAAAQAETFSYHGTLQEGGKAVNGNYDLQLTLYSTQQGGAVLDGPITLYGVTVRGGTFSTDVDFGVSNTPSTKAYLEVQVKASGSAVDFAKLDGRALVAGTDGSCTDGWSIYGNSGTDSSSNYIGSGDASNVVLKANGSTKAVLYSNGGVAMPGDVGGGAVAPGSFAGANGAVGDASYARSFVWGGEIAPPQSQPSIAATGPGQFIVQAPGGMAINTSKGEWNGLLQNELTIAPNTHLPGSSTDLALLSGPASSASGRKGFDVSVTPDNAFDINGLYYNAGPPAQVSYDTVLDIGYSHVPRLTFWHLNGATGNNPLQVAASGDTLNGNGAFLTPSGVWTNASSRTFKEGFKSIDVAGVLDKLVAMPVQTWFYKGNHDGLHMGPVAEDFAEVFGLGSNEKYIGTVDESGVALAAIQGLNQKLENENAAMHAQLDDMRTRLDRLETHAGE